MNQPTASKGGSIQRLTELALGYGIRIEPGRQVVESTAVPPQTEGQAPSPPPKRRGRPPKKKT